MKKRGSLFCALLMLMSILAGCSNAAKGQETEAVYPGTEAPTLAETSAETKAVPEMSEAEELSAPDESTAAEEIASEPETEEVVSKESESVPQTQGTASGVQEFWGYVIDRCCFEIPGPEEDTWDCLLMDSCRDSGYGLALPNDSAPNGYIWYAFDEKGQDLAFDAILNSNKWVKISLKVTGTLENDIIHVKTLKEG